MDQSEVTEKKKNIYNVAVISILNKCLFKRIMKKRSPFTQKLQKKVFKLLSKTDNSRNVSWAANQHIRIISAGNSALPS